MKLDWVPPGVTVDLASKYLKSIPQEYLSIQVRKYLGTLYMNFKLYLSVFRLFKTFLVKRKQISFII